MIIYDSKIARLLQGRLNPYDYVTFPIVTLTSLPYGEIGIWEEMEMSIHRRQYTECFLASLLPSLLLGWQVCWGLAALPLFAYYLLYWAERLVVGHSAFDYEAEKESEEVKYEENEKSHGSVTQLSHGTCNEYRNICNWK